MVGQKHLLAELKALNPIPRFSIIVGQKGSGKKLIAGEFSRAHQMPLVMSEGKIDDVRAVINTAYQQDAPILFCFPDAETMSNSAKNALLKITEEPPRQAYILLTVDSLDNIPATLISRGFVFQMDSYSNAELFEYASTYKTDETTRNILASICTTPGEINELVKYDIQEFNNFIEVVVDNIGTVSGANAFKIANKIKLKTDAEGYDMNIFLRAIISLCNDRIKTDHNRAYLDTIRVTSKYINQISNPSINRAFSFDMWILEMRGIWI